MYFLVVHTTQGRCHISCILMPIFPFCLSPMAKNRNQTKHMHTHTHIYIYLFIYLYIDRYMCVYTYISINCKYSNILFGRKKFIQHMHWHRMSKFSFKTNNCHKQTCSTPLRPLHSAWMNKALFSELSTCLHHMLLERL